MTTLSQTLAMTAAVGLPKSKVDRQKKFGMLKMSTMPRLLSSFLPLHDDAVDCVGDTLAMNGVNLGFVITGGNARERYNRQLEREEMWHSRMRWKMMKGERSWEEAIIVVMQMGLGMGMGTDDTKAMRQRQQEEGRIVARQKGIDAVAAMDKGCRCFTSLNSLPAKSCYRGTKNSRLEGF